MCATGFLGRATDVGLGRTSRTGAVSWRTSESATLPSQSRLKSAPPVRCHDHEIDVVLRGVLAQRMRDIFPRPRGVEDADIAAQHRGGDRLPEFLRNPFENGLEARLFRINPIACGGLDCPNEGGSHVDQV